MKIKTLIFLFPILPVSTLYAAPSLQMHVFEEETAIVSQVAVPEKQMPASDLSPTRKHRLKTHVFNGTASHDNKKPMFGFQHTEFYVATGYRRDELDWTIAGLNGSPTILSELIWDDIEVATINVGTTLYFKPNWLLNFDFTYGHIFDGENQDSDYRESNRQSEFSRSYSDSDRGMTLDASLHAGYQWPLLEVNQQSIYLIPKVGFSYHAQFLNDTNGRQVLSKPAPEFGITQDNLTPLGEFTGLDSHYDATWYGPWLGIESQFVFSPSFQLNLNLEYHYAFYDASADWNLRSDFAHPESYTHEAEGFGLVGNIDAKFNVSNDVKFIFSLNYQDWQANRDGVDKTFFADGTSLETKLNDVNWKSFGANIGLFYTF